MKTVDIVDYGAGNIGSVINMVKKVGGTAQVVSGPEKLIQAEKLILPGVGAFDHGMRTLIEGGWIDALNDVVQNRHIPILGICLGMQLMCKASEEGELAGLGWIDADVKRFNFESHQRPLKIPHMGWNVVNVTRQNDLVSDQGEQQRFYFVHSYYVKCNCTDDVFLISEYGNEFVAGFHHENIWGVQFHPEKSHKFGMALLRNFLEA
jgi:glutamine amidotransferase